MSLFEHMFDSGWRRRDDIEALKRHRFLAGRTARRQSSKTQQLEGRLRELEDDVAELELFDMALLRVLVAKNVCTHDEFAAAMKDLDAEDGRIDGRRDPPRAQACPNCGHDTGEETSCRHCGRAPG